MVGTVYKIRFHYEGDDVIQFRYVFATNVTEAVVKFVRYNKEQVKKGFCEMIPIDDPEVEVGYCIG